MSFLKFIIDENVSVGFEIIFVVLIDIYVWVLIVLV